MKRVNSASGFTSLLAPPTHHSRGASASMLASADAPTAVPMHASAFAARPYAALESDESARDCIGGSGLDDVASNNSTASSTSSTYSSSSTHRPSSARAGTSSARSKDSSSVRVAVRIRPLLPKEIAANERACVERDANSVTVAATEKRFTYVQQQALPSAPDFDHVFPVSASQSELYDVALQPLMDSFLQGFNVTVIAYGQTGSGKTFTMGNSIAASSTSLITSRLFAPNAVPTKPANDDCEAVTTLTDSEGLIPRFLYELFGRLKANESADSDGGGDSVSVSFLEIYGEDIHDLLQSSTRRNQDDGTQSLQLRESKAGVWVQGLTEVRVSNRKDALEQMRIGSLRRATGSTEMNEHSSRSHAVYTVKIVRRVRRRESLSGHSAATITSQRRAVTSGRRLSFDVNSGADCDGSSDGGDSSSDATIVSKLTFVDLAGSERLKRTLAEGSRMKEGIQINVGLLALGNVINALGDKTNRASAQVHVPYRSSKLTRLLQDALGGNSRTLFIACVSPAEASASESLNTLQYANRAKNIQNKAVKNIDSRSAELLGLKAFNALLRRELVRARFGPAGGDAAAVNTPQVDAMVDALLADPTVQGYLKRLEQLAMDAGTNGDFDALDTDLSALARLTAQLSTNSVAPTLLSDDTTAMRSESSPLPESDEPQSYDASHSDVAAATTLDVASNIGDSTANDDSRTAEFAEHLALWKQKCDESDREVARLEEAQTRLFAQVAASAREADALRNRVAELEANLAISKGKEEAFQLLDRCQEVWNELGLDAEDQAGKFKDINELLLKKCAEELEGLEAAREKLQARIDIAYARVSRLELVLGVADPIDVAQLPVLAGKTLLTQEKHLLVTQRQLEDELRRRFQTRLRTLRSVRELAHCMALTDVTELRHAHIEESTVDLLGLLETLHALEACEATGQPTASSSSLVDALTESPGLSLAEAALQRDERLLRALREEKTKRVAEADNALRGIRSVTQQMQFSPDDLFHVLHKAVSSTGDVIASELLADEVLRDMALWILDEGESVGVATAVLQLLTVASRSASEIYDGRANAISYLYSTLDEALALGRETLGGDASAEDARALISGDELSDQPSLSTSDASALCSSHDALVTGARRLEQLGAPIEASLRALLLSLDADFTAFGIETDAQRISFFLGSDDDENNATRKTLERYISGASSSHNEDGGASSQLASTKSLSPSCPTRSFLSDLDPAFSEFGSIYTADHSKRTLARLQDAILDVHVVQRTLASAQRRLESLQRIMKLFGEISAFKTQIASFEARARDKDRLFGSSLRLLEEEKFRKVAAKRYPSLLAALRKEVAKWLQNDDGEFDLSVLGKDLKHLLLDMMNTDTGLMHLDLGVVDTSRATTRRMSKTSSLTPTPGGSHSSSSQAPSGAQQHASAPARSRSMTVMVKDSSAKKRLAFDH